VAQGRGSSLRGQGRGRRELFQTAVCSVHDAPLLSLKVIEAITFSIENDHDRADRILAMRRARRSGDVDGLIVALRDPDTRAMAVKYLGKLGDPRAVPVLEPMLRAGDPHTRCNAAEALGKLGAVRYAEELLSLAENDPEPWVRSWAIAAAADLGAADAAGRILRLLDSEDARIRRAAAAFLGRYGRLEHVLAIRAAMTADSWLFRRPYRKAIAAIQRHAER
jgi:HEAT repeat protein